MKKLLIILGIIFFINIQSFSYEVYSLYTTKRPYKPGDIITIIVSEKANASNTANTNTDVEGSQSAEAKAGTGIFKFFPAYGVGSSQKAKYKGKGVTQKSGEFETLISAQVQEVLDNGNLKIKGQKIVQINNEKEVIMVEGIVRPNDIMHDNSVYSYKIYDAKITYSGNGVITNAQKPGILTRFFNWLF